MSSSTHPAERQTTDPDVLLQRACRDALAFPASKVNILVLSAHQATELARNEARFGQVSVDGNGLTGGMKLYLRQPLEAVAAEWRELWNNFQVALQPNREDLDALRNVDSQIARVSGERDEALAGLEAELSQDDKYTSVKREYDAALAGYVNLKLRLRDRACNMKSQTWWYWVILVGLLATECFINYNAFVEFWKVPAAAFGTMIVLGILLALAAHGHGEIVKQWAYRFGAEREVDIRSSNARILAMSSTALLIVLGFTGWARWEAAIDALASQGGQSALDGAVEIVSPGRVVAISLLANLGAWFSGVLVSYYAHDENPEFMARTAEFRKREKPYLAKRAVQTARRKQVEAKMTKEIEMLRARADSIRQKVATELHMQAQVTTRRDSLREELAGVMTHNAEAYRDALCRTMADGSGTSLTREGTGAAMTPFEYRAVPIKLEPIRVE